VLIRAESNAPVVRAFAVDDVIVADSVLVSFGIGPLLEKTGNGALAVGNVQVFNATGTVFSIDGNATDDINAFTTCVNCSGGGNAFGNPDLLSGDARVSAGSPCVDTSSTQLTALTPTSVLTDIDGECRYVDAAPDRGYDEQ
jgi:hypothetical protein